MFTEKDHLLYGDNSCCSTKVKLYVLGFLCAFGVLLTIILVPISIYSVEYSEYAIQYNEISNTIHPEVMTEGKYLLTPQTTLFKFSNLVQKMEIDMTCLTSNGIQVVLDVDVQYQMPQNQVYSAFRNFGIESNVESYLTLIMTDSIRDTCGTYAAKDYYEGRLLIQNDLEVTLIADVLEANAYFAITDVVLANYNFPEALDDAIASKRASANDIITAQNEREGSLVEANTVLLTAEVEAQKIKIGAQAEEDSILVEATAQSSAIYQIWQNRQSVYNDIMIAMEFTVDRFVFQYLSSVTLLNSEEPITDLPFV